MERGAISLADLPGGIDLQSTIESGQTYLWERVDGETYQTPGACRGNAWYRSVVDGEVIKARQQERKLEWVSTTDAVPYLTDRLRLRDDLPSIFEATPADPLLETAFAAFDGMRLVRDTFFPCVISFICSAQMRVERIFEMVAALRREFGEPVSFDGETYYAFPPPDRLAVATEAELRSLGLGYRAPYVQATAELLASGEFDPAELEGLSYEAARTKLTELVGVGEKVADCVCLFSLGHLEAVPLDTWIRTAIKTHYPDCERGSYEETSRAIREEFGPYAGYAQTYVFHYLRTKQS